MDEVKSMLRAVLMSSKGGVSAQALQKDYQDITLEPLPFRKFGFPNLESFLQSLPDVVQIRRERGEIMCHAVANKETAHIQAMVSKQKSTKKKRKLKAPKRRQGPKPDTFRPPPWSSRPPSSGGGPRGGGPRRFPGSSPPFMQQNMRNYQVVVQSRGPGPGWGPRRHVSFDESLSRGFQQAMSAANNQREVDKGRKFGAERFEKFELPPRFRNLRGAGNMGSRSPELPKLQKPPSAGTIHQIPSFTINENWETSSSTINQNWEKSSSSTVSQTSSSFTMNQSRESSQYAINQTSSSSSSSSSATNQNQTSFSTINSDLSQRPFSSSGFGQKPSPTEAATIQNQTPSSTARPREYWDAFPTIDVYQNELPLSTSTINQKPSTTGTAIQNQMPSPPLSQTQKPSIDCVSQPHFPRAIVSQSQKPSAVAGFNQTWMPSGSVTANQIQTPPSTVPLYQTQMPSATASHSPHKQEKAIFKTLPDGKKNKDLLSKYAKETNITLKFETIPTKRKGFASSVCIHGNVYGSGDVYNSVHDAECAAALSACTELNLLPGVSKVQPSAQSSVSVNVLKSRVKELLAGKPTGLWATNLTGEYKEKYKEEPPDGLLDLMEQWTDIALVEVMVTGKQIIYPVKEAPKVKAPPSVNKDLQIPKAKPLLLDAKMVVYMTYLHDCGYFCVQTEESTIDEINTKLESLASKPVPQKEDLSEGKFVAALYSGAWSRAEILGVTEDGDNYDVLYVDFGNSDQCPLSSIRWLNEELASYPVQTIYCSLHGLQPAQGSDWDQASTEKFAEFGIDQKFTAVTKCYEEDEVCSVELYVAGDPNTSVNQKLIQGGFAKPIAAEQRSEVIRDESEPEILEFPEEDQWDVYVSFINSTNSVMIRLIGEQYSDKLEELEIKLKEIFHKSDEETPQIIEGAVYIAYVEELFHRVRVINAKGRKVECLFLDHGDTDDLLPMELRPMDPSVNKLLPYQAIEVSLFGLEDIAENVTTIEKLFDLALGKTCVAEVAAKGDVPSVILYDTQDDVEINVNEAIISAFHLEAETSLLTSAGSNPQSKESSPLMQRRDGTTEAKDSLKTKTNQYSSNGSAPQAAAPSKPSVISSTTKDAPVKSSESGKPVSSRVALVKQDSSDSWETDEDEEEIEPAKPARKMDVNSNVKKSPSKTVSPNAKTKIPTSPTAKSANNPVANKSPVSSQNVTQEIDASANTRGTESTNSVTESLGDLNLGQGAKPKLYTWGKGSGDSAEFNSKKDDVAESGASWDRTEYNNRTLPPHFNIPGVGEFCDIRVIGVFDPLNFVCVPYDSAAEHDQLQRDMIEYFNTTECEVDFGREDFKMGHLYAGHQEGTWQRIIVNSIVSEALVSVYLCDIGEFTAMTFEEVQPLPLKFWKLPIQAFRSRLYGIKPSEGYQSWSESAKYKFTEMVLTKDFVGLICEVDERRLVSLRLIDTSSDSDVCIDEELLSLGFAEKSIL